MSGNFAIKGTFQKRFSGIRPLRGYPPPSPLNGKSFCQKTLSGKGGHPPAPPYRKIAENFPKKMGQKGLKVVFFGQK